uniref:Sodefrin-like factor n=1 Tax=Pinctada fucata TaxID=50426 RepID=A0A194AP13_PINFU
MKYLTFAALLVIFELHHVYGIQIECASCELAPTIGECMLKKTICGDGEECFLEKVTTDQLTIAFNAGCRSEKVCRIQEMLAAGSPTGRRSLASGDTVSFREKENERNRRNILINCAECCDAIPNEYGPCNAKLCNQRPNATLKQCLKCDNYHAGPNLCTTRDTCQDTEVCHTGIRIVDNLVRYEYGCEDKHRCKAFIQNINKTDSLGKRDGVGVKICDACCDGHECNRKDCFEIQKSMTLQSIGAVPTPPP